MKQALDFLLRHGYALVFVFVLGEQIGLPISAVPVFLAAGALAGAGRLSLITALLAAVVASVAADLLWYQLGRRQGHSVVNLICRISLEPDSCVRRTEDLYSRHGVRALLFGKFIPGLSTVMPPMAGMFGMRLGGFLLWDGAGALVWAGAYLGLGYLFSQQLELIGLYALRLGAGLLVLLGSALAAYVLTKYLERRRFFRQLHIARITPEELKEKLEKGEDIVVVDLRHALEFEADDGKVPGALHLLPDELEERHQEIPRDRDVVLYCT